LALQILPLKHWIERTQTLDVANDFFQGEIDLLGRVKAADAKADTGVSQVVVDAQGLGSGLAEVQAEPELTAICRMLIIKASPCTPAKLTLRLPGKR
jgi:hypothetical protein